MNGSLGSRSDLIAKILLFCSILGGMWLLGVFSVRNNLFPYPQLRQLIRDSSAAMALIAERTGLELPLYYVSSEVINQPVIVHRRSDISPGNTLISGMGPDSTQFVRIIDTDGDVLHEWEIDWFELWPDASHLDEELIPRVKPGTSVHGIVLLSNGDLVFNFENLGLARIDYCGDVVWRLPYRTHHSIEVAEDGNFWVGGVVTRKEPVPRLPNHRPPFDDFTVLEVSESGKVVSELSVAELLIGNGLHGLMYLSNINNWGTVVSGDTLHLNDVELFPSHLEPGLFQAGDLMLSLRNINAILVFDRETHKLKYSTIGTTLRHHDPDFVDGHTISVFDNNNLSSAWNDRRTDTNELFSRIVMIDAVDGARTTIVEGNDRFPFFTDIMGKHQWLENGNLLIAESRAGRAFEITRDGDLVWEYYNIAGEGILGLIDDAQRLSPEFDRDYVTERSLACKRNAPVTSENN